MVVPRKTHSYIRYSFLLHKEVFLLSLPEGLRIKYTAKFIKRHGGIYIKTKNIWSNRWIPAYVQQKTELCEYLYTICNKKRNIWILILNMPKREYLYVICKEKTGIDEYLCAICNKKIILIRHMKRTQG